MAFKCAFSGAFFKKLNSQFPQASKHDRRRGHRFIAQADYVLHDAVGDLGGIALAFFGWFCHGVEPTMPKADSGNHFSK